MSMNADYAAVTPATDVIATGALKKVLRHVGWLIGLIGLEIPEKGSGGPTQVGGGTGTSAV
jgi:hypothetical protein